MKNGFLDALIVLLRDTGRAGFDLTRRLVHRLRRMSWPQLLVASICLVFMVAILHLALFLFLIFMVLKLVLVTLVIGTRRQRAAQKAKSEPYTIENRE